MKRSVELLFRMQSRRKGVPAAVAISLGLMLVLTISAVPGEAQSAPDLIVWNGRIWTGNPDQPQAEAVAINGYRILEIGGNKEILSLRQPMTRLIDARKNTVLPGFIDAHFHLLDLKPQGHSINLRWVAGREELVDILAKECRTAAENEWILGEGWDERKWGGDPPSKDWIDPVCGRNPVWLVRNDGNVGLANTIALERLGQESERLRLPHSGLIRGGPMWLFDQLIIRDEKAAEELALERMQRLRQLGVTSIHHTGNWQELLIFRKLHAEGRLLTRIYAAVPFPGWERLRDYVARNGRGDRWLHWAGVKLFRQIPWIAGDLTLPKELDRWAVLPTEGEIYTWLLEASRVGLQIMVHGGDDRILRLFNRVHTALGAADLRFRIEHAHDIPDEWIPLYARAGALASMQPSLFSHFDRRTEHGLPAPRNLFPARRLLDAGVVIALGTDSVTVTPLLSPFEVIQIALERSDAGGNRITLAECLTAYTRSAAYAEFAENEKGTIEPGKLADLVVLDRNIFQESTENLTRTQVKYTILDGKVVYENPVSRE